MLDAMNWMLQPLKECQPAKHQLSVILWQGEVLWMFAKHLCLEMPTSRRKFCFAQLLMDSLPCQCNKLLVTKTAAMQHKAAMLAEHCHEEWYRTGTACHNKHVGSNNLVALNLVTQCHTQMRNPSTHPNQQAVVSPH